MTAVLCSLLALATAEDGQRFVVLTGRRPVVAIVDVRIDGKPLAEAWQGYVGRLFADLDRDGDKVLSKAEAARAPAAEFVAAFVQGALDLKAARRPVPFGDLDRDGDGRVGPDELAAYYRRTGLDRVQAAVELDRDSSAALTDALFGLLDRDGDGRLAKEELGAAGASLHRIDLNEDEWITPDELLLVRPAPRDAPRPTWEKVGLLPVEAGGLTPERARLVAARYPAFKPGEALPAPEVELTVRLGTRGPGEAAVELRGAKGEPRVRVEDVVLEVQAGSDGAGRVRGLHAFCRQQFDAAEAGRPDGLSRQQAAGSPLLAGLFTQADRDGDGRLTGQELDAFLDLHVVGAGSFASLGAADQSLGLFGLLDEDSDGRLSLRELHTAWKRLGGLDRDRDDRVGRDEFPRRLLVRVGRGPLLPRPADGATGGLTPRRSPGPDWFRRSDRNGDGYVSWREFLGPEEVFRRLDVDRDGLISPDEAKP